MHIGLLLAVHSIHTPLYKESRYELSISTDRLLGNTGVSCR